MLRGIPTAKTEINTTNKGHGVVNDTDFLVMCEEKLVLLELIGRSLNEYIWVKVKHREFSELGIDRDGGLDISVDDDEDLNSFSGLPLEQPVKTPFLTDGGWSTHVQLGTQPPIVNIDDIFGHINGSGNIPHVISTINQPLRVDSSSDGSKTSESVWA